VTTHDARLDVLQEGIRTGREHLARVDTKAGIVAALAGGGALGAVPTVAGLPGAAAVAGWAAVATAGAAAAVGILAIRPRLSDRRWGLALHASTSLDPADATAVDAYIDAVTADAAAMAVEHAAVAALATGKYRLLRHSVHLLLAAIALAAVAAVVAVA
jgi:hypothetical protein